MKLTAGVIVAKFSGLDPKNVDVFEFDIMLRTQRSADVYVLSYFQCSTTSTPKEPASRLRLFMWCV